MNSKMLIQFINHKKESPIELRYKPAWGPTLNEDLPHPTNMPHDPTKTTMSKKPDQTKIGRSSSQILNPTRINHFITEAR